MYVLTSSNPIPSLFWLILTVLLTEDRKDVFSNKNIDYIQSCVMKDEEKSSFRDS